LTHNAQKFLYVSFSKRGIRYANDASARYRCIYQAIKQRSEGNSADIIHAQDLGRIDLKQYNVIIFHRPRISGLLTRTLRKLKNTPTRPVADFDDLLFRPDLAKYSPTVLMGKQTLRNARAEATAALKALQLFKYCQMSTTGLIERAREAHANCDYKLLPNQLPDYEKPTEYLNPDERLEHKIIRYLPGTSNHAANLAAAEDALLSYLATHFDTKLEIIGDIELSEKMHQNPQVSLKPFVPYYELAESIRTSWVTIAPLIKNPFNHCKSALKFWESGIHGVPVIASGNSDTQRFVGKGLLTPSSSREWTEALETLRNETNYQEASRQARTMAEASYFPAAVINWEKSDITKSLNKVDYNTETDTKANAVIRKIKKLIRSPHAFFRDALKNNKKAP
jgi:glycosyltransferase involved in cell wall biosynthesis